MDRGAQNVSVLTEPGTGSGCTDQPMAPGHTPSGDPSPERPLVTLLSGADALDPNSHTVNDESMLSETMQSVGAARRGVGSIGGQTTGVASCIPLPSASASTVACEGELQRPPILGPRAESTDALLVSFTPLQDQRLEVANRVCDVLERNADIGGGSKNEEHRAASAVTAAPSRHALIGPNSGMRCRVDDHANEFDDDSAGSGSVFTISTPLLHPRENHGLSTSTMANSGGDSSSGGHHQSGGGSGTVGQE